MAVVALEAVWIDVVLPRLYVCRFVYLLLPRIYCLKQQTFRKAAAKYLQAAVAVKAIHVVATL